MSEIGLEPCQSNAKATHSTAYYITLPRRIVPMMVLFTIKADPEKGFLLQLF